MNGTPPDKESGAGAWAPAWAGAQLAGYAPDDPTLVADALEYLGESAKAAFAAYRLLSGNVPTSARANVCAWRDIWKKAEDAIAKFPFLKTFRNARRFRGFSFGLSDLARVLGLHAIGAYDYWKTLEQIREVPARFKGEPEVRLGKFLYVVGPGDPELHVVLRTSKPGVALEALEFTASPAHLEEWGHFFNDFDLPRESDDRSTDATLSIEPAEATDVARHPPRPSRASAPGRRERDACACERDACRIGQGWAMTAIDTYDTYDVSPLSYHVIVVGITDASGLVTRRAVVHAPHRAPRTLGSG